MELIPAYAGTTNKQHIMPAKSKGTRKPKTSAADLDAQIALLEDIKRQEAESQKTAEDLREQRLKLEKETKSQRVKKLRADIKAIAAKHDKAKAAELAPLEASLLELTGEKATTESKRVRLTEAQRDALPDKVTAVIKKAGAKGLKMGVIITNVGAPYKESHVRPAVLALHKKKIIKKDGNKATTVYSINS